MSQEKLKVAILGATGSIGDNTLKVISQHPDFFDVCFLVAKKNVTKMWTLCQLWKPQWIVMTDEHAASALRAKVLSHGLPTVVLPGLKGIRQIFKECYFDICVAGIVGEAGLKPTYWALASSKRMLLANKEILVVAGPQFMAEASRKQVELLPIDSEHQAIFQCWPHAQKALMQGETTNDPQFSSMILTASGGPFLERSQEELRFVSPKDACRHPNWLMGPKISVDSATLMNKGLEVIEAAYLFGVAPQKIEVLIHPQSLMHGLVRFKNGSVQAAISCPDMCVPISQALFWPDIVEMLNPPSLADLAGMTFQKPSTTVFPCLQLAYQALKVGQGATMVLNRANEKAVNAFLTGKISFLDIHQEIEKALMQEQLPKPKTIDDVFDWLETSIKI